MSDKEAFDFLGTMFLGGLQDASLIAELCPEGWEKSPLFACFHPSPEQRYRENLDFSRNLRALTAEMRKRKAGDAESAPEEGQLLHKKANEGPDEHRASGSILRALHVSSEKLGITGICDIVEIQNLKFEISMKQHLNTLFTHNVSTVTKAGQKRLRQVAKTCLDYGLRVQNPVFECKMDHGQFVQFRGKLLSIINPETDSIRIYHLGKNWEQKVEHHGKNDDYNIEGSLIL